MSSLCRPFRPARRNEWARLVEIGAATGIAHLLGPLLPLDRILTRGVAEARRMRRGFFVSSALVLPRWGRRLMTRIPTQAIDLRLADWVEGPGFRLNIDTRFIGAGDWSGIASPVRESPVVREAQELFAHGLDFRKTAAYAHYIERAGKGNPVRRNQIRLTTPRLVDAYFGRFAALFRSIEAHGVLSREEQRRLAGFSGFSAVRRIRAEWGEKEIGIALGREGRIYRLPGGKHREAIAMALGIEILPAQVRLVHVDWIVQQAEKIGGSLSDATLKGIKLQANPLNSANDNYCGRLVGVVTKKTVW